MPTQEYKKNFMKLTIGTGPGARPLLPEITKKSRSYTFSHPDGLLHATQFTQPALVLVEKAAFEELHHNGSVVHLTCDVVVGSAYDLSSICVVYP